MLKIRKRLSITITIITTLFFVCSANDRDLYMCRLSGNSWQKLWSSFLVFLICNKNCSVKKDFLHFDNSVLQIAYSRVQNKHTPMLINFLTFFQGLWHYSGLHRAYLSSISIRYKWGYAYSYCQIFQGLHLFKGVGLFHTLE